MPKKTSRIRDVYLTNLDTVLLIKFHLLYLFFIL